MSKPVTSQLVSAVLILLCAMVSELRAQDATGWVWSQDTLWPGRVGGAPVIANVSAFREPYRPSLTHGLFVNGQDSGGRVLAVPYHVDRLDAGEIRAVNTFIDSTYVATNRGVFAIAVRDESQIGTSEWQRVLADTTITATLEFPAYGMGGRRLFLIGRDSLYRRVHAGGDRLLDGVDTAWTGLDSPFSSPIDRAWILGNEELLVLAAELQEVRPGFAISTDAGMTWQNLQLPAALDTLVSMHAYQAYSESRREQYLHMYLQSGDAIFFSTDAGGTWSPLSPMPYASGPVAITPNNQIYIPTTQGIQLGNVRIDGRVRDLRPATGNWPADERVVTTRSERNIVMFGTNKGRILVHELLIEEEVMNENFFRFIILFGTPWVVIIFVIMVGISALPSMYNRMTAARSGDEIPRFGFYKPVLMFASLLAGLWVVLSLIIWIVFR